MIATDHFYDKVGLGASKRKIPEVFLLEFFLIVLKNGFLSAKKPKSEFRFLFAFLYFCLH